MVKLRQYFGKIATYVGHLSQVSIDADKDWKGKKITNLAPLEPTAIPDNLPLSKIPDIFGKWELLALGTLSSATSWNSGAFATKDLILVVYSIVQDGNAVGVTGMRLNGLSSGNYNFLRVFNATWEQVSGATSHEHSYIGSATSRWRSIGWSLVSGRGNVIHTPIRTFSMGAIGQRYTFAGSYNGALTITSIEIVCTNASTGSIKIYGVDL